MLNVPQTGATSPPGPPVSADDRRRILALSDERQRAREREAAAFRAGYEAAARATWPEAWEAGYTACEREEAAARRGLVRELTEPGASAGRRLAAAGAWSRRAAAAHWAAFVATAYATPARARTDVQAAVVGAGLSGGAR